MWTCPSESGHIQATGRDARGRKQYRYHAAFRAQRDAVKYERIFDFARTLPAIRAAVKRQLSRAALSRETLLATFVHLLDRTHLRIGNEEYTRLNKSFGLTTLRNRHARVRGNTLELRFRGKAGRTCYIHPSIMEAHAQGTVLPALREVSSGRAAGLRPEEKAVLVFLRRLSRATKPASAGPARARKTR